jgi:hypothetical protein
MTPSARAIAAVRRETLGLEGEPLLILDEAVAHPERLVDVAAGWANFDDATSGGDNFYPGRLAPAPLDYVGALGRALDPLIREAYGLRNVALRNASCNFALATLTPDQLSLAQRIPHVDTVDPLQFAVLHYLCDPGRGGTAFYRHRVTGYETLTPDRLEPYQSCLDREMATTPPGPGYVDGDTAQFVRTRLVEAAFNRVIVYRSCLLHSGHIPHPEALSPDPRKGRLTANIFLTYRTTV